MAASIKIWRWSESPDKYSDLSPHGGDEDWVIWSSIGEDEADDWEVERIVDQLTICDASEHPVPGGRVWITCHA